MVGARAGEPAFIRDHALDDPRSKYVPELEEERFQSLVAVPLFGKRGDPIGAITLDTEAPREFTDAEVEFLVSSASLVAGAIENARLYEETRHARRRARAADRARRSDRARRDARRARADRRRGARRELLAPSACHLYLLEPDARSSSCRASRPRAGARRAQTLGLAELGPGARPRRPRAGSPCRSSRATSCSGCSSPREAPRVELAPRGREPDRGGDQEDPGHRAAHREEPDQGLLRGARRRRGRAATSRGGRRGSAATSTSRTSCSSPSRADDALERALRRRASRARCSTAARSRCARSLRVCPRRRATRRSSELAAHARATLGEPAAVGISSVVRRGSERSRTASRRRGRRCSARPCSAASRRAGLRGARRRTSTCSGSRSTAASATRRSTRSRSSPSTTTAARLAALATLEEFLRRRGNISATVRGALRPPEHAAPAAAPDRRALRARPAARRLADGRDRGEDGAASGQRSGAATPHT